jgi:hypothetical protein
VQSSLPPTEEYFVKPPAGCPRSPPGTYWHLIRSLYGLKRAPKLWFEKLSSHLKSMGLSSSPNSPCIFTGILIEGEAPILSMSDANWGPQDATMTKTSMQLPLLLLDQCLLFILIFWDLYTGHLNVRLLQREALRRQKFMQQMNVSFLLALMQILDFLDVRDLFMPGITTIFNDKKACVDWSKHCTTKGLRHIQMRENLVRENVDRNFVTISHKGGKHNLADVFTKEMKDTAHFVAIRDLMMRPRSSVN